MSRSYKKNLVIAPKNKWHKRYANKRFRKKRYWWVNNGKQYKKIYNSYDICDYWFLYDKIWRETDVFPKWKWRMK